MSPEREIDETKGAKPDAKVAEEAKASKAAEAKAEAAEKPKPRRRTRKKAEPEAAAEAKDETAAEATEEPEAEEAPAEEPVAETADEPEAEEKPKPRRRTRRKKADEEAEEEAPTPAPTRRAPSDGPISVRARARYVRTSARKARLVCDHIRGKSVPEALAILEFTPRAAAQDWKRVLQSAVANAEANHELIGDELKVSEAYADEGPTLKRYRPRAMGRATRIRKRTSHLTITLAPAEVASSKERR
jgi:large subunit ribosomal protein L22